MLRIIAITAAVVATTSTAEAAEPFAPLEFLAGSCWEGEFMGGKAVDRHCYSWVYEGKIMRDRHRVRPNAEAKPSAADYTGETIYSYDPKSKALIYRYFNRDGEVIDGTIEAFDGTIVFPSEMQTDKGLVKMRATWTRKGDAYEAVEEQMKDGKWQHMFARTLKRIGPAAAEPAFP